MDDRDEASRTRKRPRARRRKRRRRRTAEDPEMRPGRSEDVLEVGSGEFAVLTVDRETGETVVHRFETQQEAREQFRKNVRYDAPLVDAGEEAN